MNSLRKGILGLKLFNPESQKWGQAHTQGNYVFSQFLLQNQKSEIVRVELREEEKDFRIILDREKLFEEGRQIITLFLSILNAYKSSGAIQVAEKFYDHYSAVDEKFMKVRDFVVSANIPRRLDLNNNLVYYNEQNIEPVVYPSTFEALCLSYADRFNVTENWLESYFAEWSKNKEQIRVK